MRKGHLEYLNRLHNDVETDLRQVVCESVANSCAHYKIYGFDKSRRSLNSRVTTDLFKKITAPKP